MSLLVAGSSFEMKEHDTWERISAHITREFGYYRSPLTCFRHWRELKSCSKTKIVPADRTNSVEHVGGPDSNSSVARPPGPPPMEHVYEHAANSSGACTEPPSPQPAHKSESAHDGDGYMSDSDRDEEGDPVFTEVIDMDEDERENTADRDTNGAAYKYKVGALETMKKPSASFQPFKSILPQV